MKRPRGKQPPIPENWRSFLTSEQEINLGILQNYGWRIAFIRREAFSEVVVVLQNSNDEYRYLAPDGNYSAPFTNLREEE